MKKRASALAAVVGDPRVIAMAAPAQAYWISPHLTKDVWGDDSAGVSTTAQVARYNPHQNWPSAW